MQFLKRFGYYLIGVSLGSIIVLFVWKGKDVAFPYGPNARTLRSIQKKQLQYSRTAKEIMMKASIDTSYVQALLVTGDVKFGKSKPRLKPCAEYFITGTHKERNIELYIQRCDSIATVQTVWVKN